MREIKDPLKDLDNAFIETNKEGKRLFPTDSVKYLGNKIYKNITWRNN